MITQKRIQIFNNWEFETLTELTPFLVDPNELVVQGQIPFFRNNSRTGYNLVGKYQTLSRIDQTRSLVGFGDHFKHITNPTVEEVVNRLIQNNNVDKGLIELYFTKDSCRIQVAPIKEPTNIPAISSIVCVGQTPLNLKLPINQNGVLQYRSDFLFDERGFLISTSNYEKVITISGNEMKLGTHPMAKPNETAEVVWGAFNNNIGLDELKALTGVSFYDRQQVPVTSACILNSDLVILIGTGYTRLGILDIEGKTKKFQEFLKQLPERVIRHDNASNYFPTVTSIAM